MLSWIYIVLARELKHQSVNRHVDAL
jgi:hypothetical protein